MINQAVIDRIQKIFHTVSYREQQILTQILKEISEHGYSDTYNDVWLSDYKEIPVDIDTFISDDYYLGQSNRHGEAVFPYWKIAMHEIFDAGNQYDEIIFTGATRIGKTSTAITCLSYMLYKLMCMRDPQLFFGKKDISKFSILFFNVTKELAAGVAFREFNDLLKSSPWFNEHGTFSKSDRNFYYIPEGGRIFIDYGSSGAHALGQQIFASVMDECNFQRSGIKDVQKAKANMMDTYNTISARIKGTFRKDGQVWGKLFAVSSKKSDSDFLESHIERQITSGAGNHMYVVDKPQWEILPKSMFSDSKFYIAVGDRHKRGFVVPENQSNEDSLSELRQQGYQILDPPLDMKPEFVADFDIALRDLAGISVPGALSFITQESLTACITTIRHNPFLNDILTIGTKDNLTIEEFFHIEYIQSYLRIYPAYIHLDLSLNTDRTGISCSCITGHKDIELDNGTKVSMPSFTHIFSIALEAPRGDKIPYAKILTFICWLRKQGLNIDRISRDQFQSEYMAQLLEEQGFTVDKISLDRTPDGYMALRSMILEQRIDMLDCRLLQDELIYLQRDSVTGKVDHVVGRSKDVADSFAGSLWNATLNTPEIKVPVKNVASVISKVNTGRSEYNSLNSVSSAFANLYKNRR